jgi:hypothetical protein
MDKTTLMKLMKDKTICFYCSIFGRKLSQGISSLYLEISKLKQ